ncbi:hypothetical protein ElyMa_004741700 [Elysia marginata]|uniref:Uncharacterized protein n=1 Tax=Elysia marginata TaxID=1093978 RepID=A0AAV4IGV7_9GAST|nr:hypothetical protein ElyMa_004741700 [Elysia marginata]
MAALQTTTFTVQPPPHHHHNSNSNKMSTATKEKDKEKEKEKEREKKLSMYKVEPYKTELRREHIARRRELTRQHFLARERTQVVKHAEGGVEGAMLVGVSAHGPPSLSIANPLQQLYRPSCSRHERVRSEMPRFA